jgi:D-alanyl-lipoteichoic acid acyltransferase DltB (MBOAT superfamily)
MGKQIAKYVAFAIFAFVLIGLTYISRDDFLVASGSDVSALIVRQPLHWQVIFLVISLVALLAYLMTPRSPRRRYLASAFGVAFLFFVLSLHMLLLNGRTHELEDLWSIFRLQSLPFQKTGDSRDDIQAQSGPVFVTFQNYDGNTLRFFRGVYPVRHGLQDSVLRDFFKSDPEITAAK